MKRQVIDRLLLCLTAAFLLVFGTACSNENEIKAQVSKTAPSGLAKVKYRVASGKIKGTFNEDGQKVCLECKITVKGELDGQPYSQDFNVTLCATGSKGGTYDLDCTDPLLVQVPNDVTGVKCSLVGGHLGTFAKVQTGIQSLKIDNARTLYAEPGTQFVLVEAPASGLRDGIYDATLSFNMANSRPIDIKAMVVGKAIVNGVTYYPPMAPPVDNMSQVPTLHIPQSDVLTNLPLPLDGLPTSASYDIQG